MTSWSVQDAKARFDELLEACFADGPQVITKNGEGVAVLVPIEAWRRLQRTATPTLKELLLTDAARGDLTQPPRGLLRRRADEHG